MITLCNYKPKWTASLSSVPSSFCCLVQRQSPCAVPLQGVERGTQSIPACKKAPGKEVREKSCSEGEPCPAADSTGMITHTRVGDSTVPKAANASTSCHPTPQNCHSRSFKTRHRFHCQNSPSRAVSLLGSEEQVYAIHTVPECTGAGLERMTQLHQKSSFPCLMKPSSNSAQAQPVAALLWASSHRNPGKQSRRQVRRRTALTWCASEVCASGLLLTLWSNSSWVEGRQGGHPSARPWSSGVCTHCCRAEKLCWGVGWTTKTLFTVLSSGTRHRDEAAPRYKPPWGEVFPGEATASVKSLQLWDADICSKEHSSGCSQHTISFQWHLPSNCWDGL